MERSEQRNDELIDLGSVTAETKGVGIQELDQIGGEQIQAGLADD